LDSYDFLCDCEACSKDFPTKHKLPKFDESFITRDSFDLTAEAAIEEFKNNCEYIVKNFHHFPCKELVFIEDRNRLLLLKIAQFAVLIGSIPN